MLGETVALNLSSASPYQSSVITTNPQHTPQSFCMQAFPWQLWCGGACLATRSLFLLPILLMACRFAERAGWRLVADKRSCVYLMLLLLYGSKWRELSAAAHVLMFPVCLGQKCHFLKHKPHFCVVLFKWRRVIRRWECCTSNIKMHLFVLHVQHVVLQWAQWRRRPL